MGIKDRDELIQAIDDREVLAKLKSYLAAVMEYEKELLAKGKDKLTEGKKLWLLAFKGGQAKLSETKDDYWDDIVLLLNSRER